MKFYKVTDNVPQKEDDGFNESEYTNPCKELYTRKSAAINLYLALPIVEKLYRLLNLNSKEIENLIGCEKKVLVGDDNESWDLALWRILRDYLISNGEKV